MRVHFPLLFILALAPLPGVAAASEELTQQQALARAPGGGALLYREEHLLRSREGRPVERLVVYRCPSGAAFARKHVDYSASATAPAFALEDARGGYREGLRRVAARTELYFRADRRQDEQRVALPTAPAVADAGFDEFIRAHWDALAAGESLPLAFAVPARLRTMEFLVKRAGSLRIDGEEAPLFRLRLDGLLGFVAPHIDVAYSERTRRLLRFEGLGNLRAPRGDGQWEVRIDFPRPAGPVAAARWPAALSEKLVERCESGQAADSVAGRTPTGLI